ncbi:MAG: chorismate synthase [Firmicutes bacterium]|nr:chorismate synthase [Bacillota bacterium]
MSFTYGNHIKISIFGQSHAPAIGVVMEGIPAGHTIDLEKLQAFLNRRAPGQGPHTTTRKEADVPEFLSGLVDGKTCGTPICAIIRNNDTRAKDYEQLRDIPRPGHADYTGHVKYGGHEDVRGGGAFSGRMTAPLCIAGGIIMQILEKEGISFETEIKEIGGSTENFYETIAAAKEAGDSVGGIIGCVINGLPAGIGGPLFGGVESKISQIVFAIPAVKGIEFGRGFDAARIFGSENNDAYYFDGETVRTRTNHHGGILGGITSGMPVTFHVAIKPTPSIAKEQDSISYSKGEAVKLQIQGRHDPCIVPRALPCVEAVAAIAVYDLMRGE